MFAANTDATPERPECTLLTGTSLTTLYTVTSDDLTLVSGTFVHDGAGSHDCRLVWRSVDTAVDATVWFGTVTTKTTEGTQNPNYAFPIRLKKGDIIKAQGGNGVWVNLLFMRNRRNV